MSDCQTCGGFDYEQAARSVPECGMDRAADEHRPPYGEDDA